MKRKAMKKDYSTVKAEAIVAGMAFIMAVIVFAILVIII